MIRGSSIVEFSLPQSHPAALRTVRKKLSQHGLRIAAELDITAHIRQELGACLAPCIVLYIYDPLLLLEAAIFHRGAALVIPQPIVLSGGTACTTVLLQSMESLVAAGLPASVQEPLYNLHIRMVRAVETVASNEVAC